MSLLAACPFCGSLSVDWVIPPYERAVHMACDDCSAQGPRTPLGSVNRHDRDAIAALALASWNDRVQS